MSIPPPTAPLVPKATPYLTIIPSRSPEQKVHTSLVHAKNAITGKTPYRGAGCDMWLYEQGLDGQWKLMYSVAKGTPKSDLPWRLEASVPSA